MSPCENTLPSQGTLQLVQRRVTVSALLCTPPLVSTSRVSQEEGEWFSLTHQRQFMLYISCVRKTMTVVWRESESQWNTVAYSIIPVVMETAEQTKSVKWLQGLLVTKLIIRGNASAQLRAHFTENTGQKYDCLSIYSIMCFSLGKCFLAFLIHLKLQHCPFQWHSNLSLLFRPVQVQTCLLAGVTNK